jgi:hypothetical protein
MTSRLDSRPGAYSLQQFFGRRTTREPEIPKPTRDFPIVLYPIVNRLHRLAITPVLHSFLVVVYEWRRRDGIKAVAERFSSRSTSVLRSIRVVAV